QIVSRSVEYRAAQSEYSNLREQAGSENEDGGIQWDALAAINPGVVGWIVVPNTDISYPIVQGSDNARYLRYTFNGTRNASGAIFLDYRDQPNFSGRAKIYGHNMRDGTMFSSLLNWQGDYFTVHTPDGVVEFVVTARGALPLAEIVQLDGVALITCVNGRPEVRWVVQAERVLR
ncbi:MAG: class B sortase, partial [Oscillospiraceae bacterium]|nr:class B sortase [Oscillospiraceae bacterium]